nr:hypothetical protein [Bacillus sp. SRB3LM]
MQRKDKKGKEERRKNIAIDRNQAVEEMHEALGEKFIVFPNPMYGDWESALYQYDFKKSDAEKDKFRKDALRVFKDGK